MDSRGQISRRTALRQAGALAAAVAALEAAGPLAFVPQRALAAAAPSDIQFDISAFLSSPPQTFGSGVKFQLPPVHEFGVDPTANGLERFITATRRQNFLVPPRRHRAFPLIELA